MKVFPARSINVRRWIDGRMRETFTISLRENRSFPVEPRELRLLTVYSPPPPRPTSYRAGIFHVPLFRSAHPHIEFGIHDDFVHVNAE